MGRHCSTALGRAAQCSGGWTMRDSEMKVAQLPTALVESRAPKARPNVVAINARDEGEFITVPAVTGGGAGHEFY